MITSFFCMVVSLFDVESTWLHDDDGRDVAADDDTGMGHCQHKYFRSKLKTVSGRIKALFSYSEKTET